MSSPTQVSSQSTSHSPKSRPPRLTMTTTLPPVFSSDHSPPSGFANRKHYLPLMSPMATEDDICLSYGQRRESTLRLHKSNVSHYFEDLRKRRRTSECSTSPHGIAQAPVFCKNSKEGDCVAELPTSFSESIQKALQMQTRSSSSSSTSANTAAKRRALSMPSTKLSSAWQEEVASRLAGVERRSNVRSHQLALLASQARLARTGATSVSTALRAERAVEGAVRKVVEDAESGKAVKGITEDREGRGEREEGHGESEGGRDEAMTQAVADLQDPTRVWAQALSSPHSANAFFNSASEVAHDWANGFYAFEKEWAGDALRKERGRLSVDQSSRKRQREEEREAGDEEEQPASPKPKSNSEPATRNVSPMPQLSLTTTTGTVLSSLVAAQKRMSTSLPSVGPNMPGGEGEREGESRGKLVDVLSNFASLIEQRQEGCHGLERLAQDAKRLSTVQLPTLRTPVSPHRPSHVEVEEEDEDEDEDDNGEGESEECA